MALFHPFSCLALVFLHTLLSLLVISHQQPLLDPAESDAVFRVLNSVNPAVPWRTVFPDDDLCSSAPHGVVCDYFFDDNGDVPSSAHITELSFGFVSDYAPNPPCSSDSTIDPTLFTAFKFLRKLFFYKCFTNETRRVSLPADAVSPGFSSALEELVFIDNPALVGPLGSILRNYTNLRRVVLTGNGVYGEIPEGLGDDSVGLEELTLSRNQLSSRVPSSLSKLKSLRVLDLSHNHFDGYLPEALGNLTELLKLDLTSNGFSGKIPERLRNLQSLEFLDLSYNRFGNYGLPLFLAEMPRLREVHLSGNPLGGAIPEIWKNLGGVLGIGLSNTGLVGNIPASMGVHLRNLRYLGLDNNSLEGTVPVEFALLGTVSEINLENNNLSGRLPFSAKIGGKLKLGGNPELCVDERLGSGSLEKVKVCANKPVIPNATLFSASSNPLLAVPHALVFLGFLVCLGLINS
ncbi:piriformospora indica-insensitive protein 2 [Corylus avellana]|uniref:piriformospora indica-insensitive protein 2 n=1 Tax=Corylus avellana TaxID=13451 RepID=UPI001E2114A0|nr:piriformospora indica-insensitive protein 2 [Corylus avellana]